jgi:hypothetical protein
VRWVSELKSGKGDNVSRAVWNDISSGWAGGRWGFSPTKRGKERFTSSVVELRGNADTSLILAWEGEC